MALGLRHQGSSSRIINFLSDGELDEGSTWEAAISASHHRLGNLTALVDINALQADGPTAGVLRTEPIADKWAACGWFVRRVDGNDVDALLTAFDDVAAQCSVWNTGGHSVRHRVGWGVPLLKQESALHAHRPRRMATLPRQLTAGYTGNEQA